MPDILYHVTQTWRLKRILADGLVPQIGPRSRRAREREPAVYFFASAGAIGNAVANWVLEEFSEDDRLSVLCVELPSEFPVHSAVGWERHVFTVVPPGCLRVMTRDIWSATGYGFLGEKENAVGPGAP